MHGPIRPWEIYDIAPGRYTSRTIFARDLRNYPRSRDNTSMRPASTEGREGEGGGWEERVDRGNIYTAILRKGLMRARGWARGTRRHTARSRLATESARCAVSRTSPEPAWFQSAAQIRRVRVADAGIIRKPLPLAAGREGTPASDA